MVDVEIVARLTQPRGLQMLAAGLPADLSDAP